jgi:hypothetical protein
MKDLFVVMEAVRSAQTVLFEYQAHGTMNAQDVLEEMIHILCDADVLSATDAIHPKVASPELVPHE